MRLTALQTLEDAMKLLRRYDEGEGFQRYVKKRLVLVLPMAALMLGTGIVFASATIVLAGPRIWLALPSMLVAPLLLLGSVFVQAYLFFSWIENRAMAQALGHPSAPPGPLARWVARNLRAELGVPPPVPWDLAAVFLALPVLILVAVSWQIAAALGVLYAAAVVAYARLDRRENIGRRSRV
jgi:hypothetical protein